MLEKDRINDFARQLENLFHGQSSGLDISGVAAQSVFFLKQVSPRI